MPGKSETENTEMSRDQLSPSVAAKRVRKPAKPRVVKVGKEKTGKSTAATGPKKPVKSAVKAKATAVKPVVRRATPKRGTTEIKNPVKLSLKERRALEMAAFQGLDARQAKFVDLWLVTYNAKESYRDAGFACKNDNAAAAGASRLLSKVKSHPYMLARQVELFSRTAEVQNQLIATYHAASFADPRELVEYVRRCCRYCYGIGHKFQLRPSEMERRRNQYEADKAAAESENKTIGDFDELGGLGYDGKKSPSPDCPECDGEGEGHALFKDTGNLSPAALTLFEGVKEGKDGTELKIASQKGYRDGLAKLFNMNVEPAVVVNVGVSEELLEEILAKAEANTERNREAMAGRAEELAKIGIVN